MSQMKTNGLMENMNLINGNNNGNSSNAMKKLGTLHRRYNSNSYIGENNNQNNFIDNLSKMNLLKEEDKTNDNPKGNNLPLNNLILKNNTPIVTFNRKKSTISPLQSQKEKFIINNNNNNNNSNNNFFNNGNINKNSDINKLNSENRPNEYGTIDIKFEIKNKHFQLPNLYPENEFKKINNYKSIANIKRGNNSITPNKIVYNSPNLTNMIAARKEVNMDNTIKSLRRFNYPSSTQILQSRMNRTPDFANTNRSANNSNTSLLVNNNNDHTNITNYSNNKGSLKLNYGSNIEADNYIRQNHRILNSRQNSNNNISRLSRNFNSDENNGNGIVENSYYNSNNGLSNNSNSISGNLILSKLKQSMNNDKSNSGILGNNNNNSNSNANSQNIQSKISDKSLKKRLTLLYDNLSINNNVGNQNNINNSNGNSNNNNLQNNNNNSNNSSEKKVEVFNYAKLKNFVKKDEDEVGLGVSSKKNLTEKLSKFGSNNESNPTLNSNINNSNSNPGNNSSQSNNYNLNFGISKNPTNVNSIMNNPMYNSNSNQINNNSKTSIIDNNGNITHFYAIQNNNGIPNHLLKGKSMIKKSAFTSLAGKTENGSTKTNQDNYVLMENILNCEDYRIYGVFDGHGTYGHFVSSTLSSFFNQFYRSVENYTTKIPRFKNASPEKKNNNNNYNYSQLRDTKIETIYAKLKENNYEVIRNSFFLAEDECSLGKFDLQFSGSTCVLIFCIANKIICANAGDSRAILVTENTKKAKSFISK